jgi:hypothetical protein
MGESRNRWEEALHDPDRKTEKDYDASDIEHVFRRGEFRDWRDVLKWLDEHGMDDRRLTPGEAKHMREDFERLRKAKVKFTNDPKQAYELARQHRGRAAA